MLHSIIINSSSSSTQKQHLKRFQINLDKDHPDLLQIKKEPSIGIKNIKVIFGFLAKKPYQAKDKTVIIHQAHLLTLAAQNSILKTLEEPPPNSKIFLLTNNVNTLLPTIISRCQVIDLSKSSKNQDKNLSIQKDINNQLQKACLSERLNLVSKYSSSKTTAMDWIHQQLIHTRTKLPQTLENIRQLQKTKQLLKANVNPKLALENLIFHYSKT